MFRTTVMFISVLLYLDAKFMVFHYKLNIKLYPNCVSMTCKIMIIYNNSSKCNTKMNKMQVNVSQNSEYRFWMKYQVFKLSIITCKCITFL